MHNKTVTICNKLKQNKNKKKTCVLLFMLQVSFNDIFYKETKQKPCHYIPNIMQYYMTLKLTNDIHFQLGFSPKLGQIQKALLTKA